MPVPSAPHPRLVTNFLLRCRCPQLHTHACVNCAAGKAGAHACHRDGVLPAWQPVQDDQNGIHTSGHAFEAHMEAVGIRETIEDERGGEGGGLDSTVARPLVQHIGDRGMYRVHGV